MRIPTLVAMAAMLVAGAAFAHSATMTEAAPGLLKRARITPDAATATAQAKVPKGKIESAEIEDENGRLIYSFDINTAGKSGIDEVNVDAHTGKVVSVAHETPRQEANEKAADTKKP
jgi:uncharacterized membrane protein YkoI